MATSLVNRPMPKWLRRALKARAVTYQEAEAFWHLHLLATPEQASIAPKWLHPACDRLYLLELPSTPA